MADQRTSANKNVAAQHHDEQAREHDKDGHLLDAEHDNATMPAHKRESKDLLHEQRSDR